MSQTTQSPKYKHNCSNCIFLGHSRGYDVYYCNRTQPKEFIARRSDEVGATVTYTVSVFKNLISSEDTEDTPPIWRMAIMESLRRAGIKV